MPKIFFNKSYNKDIIGETRFLEKKGDYIGATRPYPPANKEWHNSVYTYNKNSIKLIPVADNIIIDIITGYFNMYSKYLEKKNRMRRLNVRQKKSSLNRSFLSKPELKHTNDKVIINIFMFVSGEKLILNRIKKLLSRKFFNKLRFSIKNKTDRFVEKVRWMNKSFIKNIKKNNKDFFIKLALKDKLLINFEKIYLNNLIKKSLKKEIFIMHLVQSLFFNRLKSTSLYLEPLILILKKVYSKKVILNIIKLKTYILNSDIFTQILIIKIKQRKNNISRVLKVSLARLKTPVFRKEFIERESTKLTSIQNILLKDNERYFNEDRLNNVIDNYYNTKTRLDVLNSIKNKTVSGVRLEGSGRLTKRMTAARSLTKIKYKGTLKNVDSSYRGLSSVMIRGNIRSNTQYSILNSKTRIGAFGLKGWISST